jgi:hypothetical protein
VSQVIEWKQNTDARRRSASLRTVVLHYAHAFLNQVARYRTQHHVLFGIRPVILTVSIVIEGRLIIPPARYIL